MKTWIRGIALMLVAIMLCMTTVACKGGGDDTSPTDTIEGASTDEDAGFTVERASYGKDFNVLYPQWGTYQEFFFYDEANGDMSDSIDSALYKRTELLRDYLGVNLKAFPETVVNGVHSAVASKFTNSVLSGDGAYQLFLSHTFAGVSGLVTGEYLYDFNQLTDINLDAGYWNKDAMERLEIDSALYYGLSDFMLSDPNAVFFNKTLQADYNVSDPYEMVRDGTWTLENMTVESKKVNVTGDKTTKDLGFAAIGDWHFMSLYDSCDIELVIDEGGYSTLNMGADNEKFLTVYEQLDALCKEESTLIYSSNDPESEKILTSGRVLFTFVPLHQANTYRSSEVTFGILPYPKYDEEQEEYHSFDWSGLMCVPVNTEDPAMTGQVLECLSYFSADTIHIAYYEKLLGAKLADAPDDYEMIRKIYDNLVTNPVLNMMNEWNSSLGSLAYMYRHLTYAYAADTQSDSIAVMWARYGKSAQIQLDETINR